MPLLPLAIRNGDKKQVTAILNAEREGTIPKSDYNELLNVALLFDKIEIAELLILSGADVNTVSGDTPLIKKYVGKHEHTKLLIKYKANLTPDLLDIALHTGALDIVTALIKNGINPNRPSPYLNTISLIESYISLNNQKVVECLLNTKLIDVKQYPPLLTVCQDNEEMQGLILKCGYDINEFGNNSEPSLFRAIRAKNQKMLNFHCQHSADLNIKNKFDEIPLAVAIRGKNYQPAQTLLNAGANPLLLPHEIYRELFQDKSAEAQTLYQVLLKQAKESLKGKLNLEQITSNVLMNLHDEIVNMDFEKMRNLLRAQIKTSRILPEIADKLCTLLDSDKPLPTRALSRFHLVSELLVLIQHPEIIHQKNTNLCGPAAFLGLMITNNPTWIIDLAIELITTSKTTKPFSLTLSAFSKNKSQSIIEVLLVEIRRSENWTGYSPVSKREGFQGLTAPRVLSKWLEESGCEEVEDRTEAASFRGKPLVKPAQWLLNAMFFGFHQKEHQRLTKERMFELLRSAVENQKSIILLISPQMMEKIFGDSQKSKGSEVSISKTFEWGSCCYIAIDHYVCLKNLEVHENNIIHLEIMTYGDSFKAYLPLTYFLEHCRGGIFTKTSNKKAKEITCNQTDTVLLESKDNVEAVLTSLSSIANRANSGGDAEHSGLGLNFSFRNLKMTSSGSDSSQLQSTGPHEQESIRARRKILQGSSYI